MTTSSPASTTPQLWVFCLCAQWCGTCREYQPLFDQLAINMPQARFVWVDVEEVLRASTSKPQALSLLDGELLEDLDGVDPSFDQWLAGERERLRGQTRFPK